MTISGPAVATPSRHSTACDLPGLVDAMLPGYAGRPANVRPMDRRNFAVKVAGTLQAAFNRRAIDGGNASWAGMTDAELARLDRAKHMHDSGEPWEQPGLPLVLVRPRVDLWDPPAGVVCVIDATTDVSLLRSLLNAGAIAVVTCWADDGRDGRIEGLE